MPQLLLQMTLKHGAEYRDTEASATAGTADAATVAAIAAAVAAAGAVTAGAAVATAGIMHLLCIKLSSQAVSSRGSSVGWCQRRQAVDGIIHLFEHGSQGIIQLLRDWLAVLELVLGVIGRGQGHSWGLQQEGGGDKRRLNTNMRDDDHN